MRMTSGTLISFVVSLVFIMILLIAMPILMETLGMIQTDNEERYLEYLAEADAVIDVARITDATITNADITTADITTLNAPTGRTAALVVAASDSSALSKAQADYVCDGTADNVQIQRAIDELPTIGGSLMFMEGDYTLSAAVSRAINDVTIIGSGKNTYFANNASTALFSVGSQTGWIFNGFSTDAGWLTLTSASDYIVASCWNNGVQTNTVGATTFTSGNITGDLTVGGNATISGNLTAATGRTATHVIASANATALEKAQADAICDGADDDVQIQAAIDSISTGDSVVIECTKGTFYLGSGLSWTDKYVYLKGQGTSTILDNVRDPHYGTVFVKEGDFAMLDINYTTLDTSGFNIEGIEFDGNRWSGYTGKGIVVNNALGWTIEKTKIIACENRGLEVTQCGYHRLKDVFSTANQNVNIYYNSSYDWMWENVETGKVRGGAGVYDSVWLGNGTEGSISNSHFEGGDTSEAEWGRDAIHIEEDTATRGFISIADTYIFLTGRHGIYIGNVTSFGVRIDGVTFNKVNESNLTAGSAVFIADSENIQVNNCSIQDSSPVPTLRYGIYETGSSDNNIITNNHIRDALTANIVVIGDETRSRLWNNYPDQSGLRNLIMMEMLVTRFKGFDDLTGWTQTTNGTASISGAFGISGVNTGATANSQAGLVSTSGFWFNRGSAAYRWRLGSQLVPEDADGGQEGWFGAFAANNAFPTTTSNHVGFRIVDDDIFASNGNGAGTQTQIVTSFAPNSNQRLWFIYMASKIEFYVDDVLMATHTTNLPSNLTLYPGYWNSNPGVADAANIQIYGLVMIGGD